VTEPLGMLPGERVYRVHWVPGSDSLLGICHCGAECRAEEPVALWDWLLAHPDGHRDGHRDGHPAGHSADRPGGPR
jgi:hypothetical protein